MTSQSQCFSLPARRLVHVRMTVMALSIPLWCRSRGTAWQALMRTRVMAEEPVQTPRWATPGVQPAQ